MCQCGASAVTALLPFQLKRVSQMSHRNTPSKTTAASVIEYGLIAAGISVAIIAVVQGLGSKLNTTLGSVSTALK
jgi:pilus assembly protein Flp/PilA